MDETSNLVTRILARNERLSSDKITNDSLMRDIAEHVQPRKANNINGSSLDSTPDDVNRLYDTTAMNANQTLGAGMHSNITPMGSIFASLNPPQAETEADASYDLKNWFHRATQILHKEIGKSNFHSAADEFYLDHGGFGTAAMICRMSNKGKLVYETLEMGSYGIMEGEDRRVDTLYRTYTLTPRQIKQQFEDVPASVDVKANDDKTKDIPLTIIHAIEPRENYDPKMVDAKNMPIASVYVLQESKEVLKESGYYELPFAVSRWRLWGASPWGWSPSYYALPIANQLNFLEQCIDVGVERMAFPAWMIPNTMKGEFDPRPHGRNIYDASVGGDQAMPKELESRGRIDVAVDREEQKRKQIREAFFEDMFKLLSRMDKPMTAREVTELTAEKTTLFHPFFARLTTEFLIPILTRTFAELLRAGKFGDPPEGLFQEVDGEYVMDDPEIEFNSRLSMALEMTEISGLLQTIDELAPMAEVMGPQVFDWLDDAKLGPKLARARGVSSEVMRSSEQIDAVREQRAQQAQQAAEAEQAQQLAGAIGSVGGVDQAQQLMGG